jgi:hypothetical protein
MQTDGKRDMTKLIVLFEILRKAPKKELLSPRTLYCPVEISMKFYFKVVRSSMGM